MREGMHADRVKLGEKKAFSFSQPFVPKSSTDWVAV